MPLASLARITKDFSGRLILRDVSLDVEPGRRIGIVGRNGCGKSTLLKILAREMDPSSGDVAHQRGLRVARQAQELVVEDGATVHGEMRRVFAEHLDREQKLRALEDRIAECEGREQELLLEQYARLQDAHETARGWDVEQRIEAILTGLGLPRTAWEQPIAEFSGGERNLIALARILGSEPDLVLLDEPSNHLDLDGLEWFVRWLRQTPSSVVMVSHDRHLLDATVHEIWEVRDGKVTTYTGGYSEYLSQKEEAQALQERQWRNQQRLIQRIEFQARRLKDMAKAYDDPGQAKRAKAMLARIERMEKVEKPQEDDRVFRAGFKAASRHGEIALQVRDYDFAFGKRKLFENAQLEVGFGERVGLVGPNGCGKSTLFRDILEHGTWEGDRVRIGKAVRIGDYNQFHEDAMDEGLSLLEWTMQRTGLLRTPASDLLHKFLFSREDLEREIGTLSGGEKSRLQLLRLAHAQVNFLMLDEPTNHLDIQSAEHLEDMLTDYDGTLLVISHDRWFLEKVVNVIVEVKDLGLLRFPGSFAEWWSKRQQESAELGSGPLKLRSREAAEARQRTPKEGAADRKREHEERKARQKEDRRLRNRLTAVERKVEELEAAVEQQEKALEDHWSGDATVAKGQQLAATLEATRQDLERHLAEWEELSTRLEERDAS